MKTRFWRLCWSKDWKTFKPWSLNGNNTPYVGFRTSRNVLMIVLGPLSIQAVDGVK